MGERTHTWSPGNTAAQAARMVREDVPGHIAFSYNGKCKGKVKNADLGCQNEAKPNGFCRWHQSQAPK